MKLIFILFAITLSGCQSLTSRIDAALPEGKADSIKATVNGKFTSTTVVAEKLVKDAKHVTADKLLIRNSNPWVQNTEVEITGYERARVAK